MDDFWVVNSRKFDQAHIEPYKFEEFDFEALLSKYGPEGLWELSDKLREFAKKDAVWTEDDSFYR